MTKARTQPEAAPPREERRTGLKGFVYHQSKMVEETGKALVSLLPQRVPHARRQRREGVPHQLRRPGGWCRGSLEAGLDKLRSKPKPEDPGKVKVEVE